MRAIVLLAVLGGLLTNEVVNADSLGRLGCRYYEDALIFNCDGSSLDRVLEAVRYLEQKFSHTTRIPVRHVNLLHGDFTELPFFLSKFNETLEGIRIHNTNLTHIYPDAFSGLSRVRFLDLSKNNLTAIPYAVSALHSLQFLNVSSNRLRTLEPRSQFSSWRRLRLLDLSTNYIDKLEFLDLNPSSASIERILLDNNDLPSVPPEWSSLLLAQLKEISLNNNALKTIPVFHVKFTPQLTTIRLRKNNIETFPFYFMPSSLGGNLTVDMSGNPLRCDCEAMWLREWRLQTPRESLRLSLPTCAHPATLRGAHLENIDPVQLTCPKASLSARYRARGFPNHTILALTTLEHSISVTWKVDDQHLPWSIVYRQESESPYAIKLHNRSSEGPHSSADAAILTDIVQGLESESRYVICAALSIAEGGSHYFEMDPAACQAVSTKGPRHNVKNGTEQSHQASSLFMAPVAEKRRVSQFATTQLLVMRGGQRSIWVRWRLKVTQPASGNTTLYRTRRDLLQSEDELTASREWIVLTRRIGTGNFSEVRVSDTSGHVKNGNVYNYTVSSLASDTAYDCCLVPVDTLVEDTMADRSVPGGPRDIPVHLRLSVEQTQMICKEIVTLADSMKRPTLASSSSLDGSTLIIVVIATSALITAIVVAVVCFCCCPASRNILKRFSDGISHAPCKSASNDKTFSISSAERSDGKGIGGASGASHNNRLRMNNSFNSTKNLVNFMDDEPSQLNNASNFMCTANGGNINNALQRQMNSMGSPIGGGSVAASIDGTIRRIPMKPPNIPLPPIPTEASQGLLEADGVPYKISVPPIPPPLGSRCRSETFDNKIATLDAGRLTLLYSEWEDMPAHSQVTQRPRRSRSEVRAPAARPFTSLGNVCAASRDDPFRTMRSLGSRPPLMGSDGGSYNDTSSDDDKKILNAQPRKIQRNKTTINWANAVPVNEDSDGAGAVAYLDGRKVQVFGLGASKTLPKSILRKGARPLAPNHVPMPPPATATRVAGRSAARTQSHHSRSFKKLARSPPIMRRSSQAQNQRLNFCTFGKEIAGPCAARVACSACAAESQSVTSNSDNCSSTKHLCAHSSTTSSDCDVFIEHV